MSVRLFLGAPDFLTDTIGEKIGHTSTGQIASTPFGGASVTPAEV